MTMNVGTPDRIVRLILGLILIAAPFITGWALFASSLWIWVSVIVGLVLVVTGVVRFCPTYRVIGASTAKESGR